VKFEEPYTIEYLKGPDVVKTTSTNTELNQFFDNTKWQLSHCHKFIAVYLKTLSFKITAYC
jgi:hypothetical protein